MNETKCAVKWGPVLALVCLQMACRPTAQDAPPASPPPAPAYVAQAPPNPPTYTPAKPMQRLVPGVMMRSMYVAEPSGRHQIEITELLVGAGKKSEPFALSGAAVWEIASGAGSVTIGGKVREIRSGDVFAIDEGQQTVIESRQGDLMIRATVIRRAGK